MNIVVKTQHLQPTDIPTLYGDTDNVVNEEIKYVDPTTTLTDLVYMLGLYKTKSEARRANRVGPIPTGWNVIKGNRKTPLYIWNPTY